MKSMYSDITFYYSNLHYINSVTAEINMKNFI